MRRAAFLVALVTAGCASSPWQKTESVPGGRLYIPKVYAPLLPGSIYPDRKAAVPAKRRPALIVVCPEKGDCRKDEILEQAAQRAMVVLILTHPASALQKIDLLRTRAEASAANTGWLLVQPDEDFLRRWMQAGASGQAAAVIGMPRHPSAPDPLPSYPSKTILIAALLSDAPLEAKDGTVLKLYSPNKEGLLPREAFRDAVEWLAGALGAR
ncbi:MAG TPA: hypothetical protein VF554_14215 [Thermoanaerobaculia bacterium]|jgi:hypothetical protein